MKKLAAAVALMTALCGLPAPAQTPDLTFNTVNLSTGNGPDFVLAVDINNDGFPGLVAANFGFRFGGAFGGGLGSGSTLSVFTNDGFGNLSSNATLTVGNEPACVAAADLNGDGWPDLVSANVGDDTVTVLTNNRMGGFVLSGTYSVGFNPVFVTTADVNGDGKLDLITADYGGATMTVLTNDGHGGFKLSSFIPVGNQPNCVAAVDINGDGKVDLVCANSGDNTLQTFTNNGKGVFTSTATINVAGGAGWVVGTDVNDDGTIDLVAAGPTLTVLTNNGHGDFTLESTSYSTNSGMIVAADMNGDGHVDLVCPNNGNGVQGFATVLTNDGHGVFTADTTVPIGIPGFVNYPNTVTVADFDGDGNLDIAVDCYASLNYDTTSPSTLTVLTQINVPPIPTLTITSPANDSVFPSSASILIKTKTVSSYPPEVMLFYIGQEIIGVATNAPFQLTTRPGAIMPGTHALQAFVVDASGEIGYSPEIQINITPSNAGPPPVVTVTSPTNGAVFVTTQKVIIQAKTSLATSQAELYLDGQALEGTVITPYTFQFPPGSLAVGAHTLQVVATTSAGASGSSPIINISMNAPGIDLINFDALDTSAGAVGGTTLANYLALYGVTMSKVTVGTALQAESASSVTGGIQVNPSSAPNFFTQAGLNQPVSFTLNFASPLQSFGFTRVGLSSPSGQVSHPAWTATIFDANGNPLGAVSEGLIVSSQPVGAKSFVLIGANIASVRFDSDSQGVAAFSAVLLDDLRLNANPTTPNLSVTLNVVSPPVNNIVAPATIVLGANVTDTIGAVGVSYSVSYFAGATLLGTANSSPYQITWNNVLAGTYSVQARVTDVSGVAAYSTPTAINVQLGPNSTEVNFDSLATSKAPVTGTAVASYLAGFGVSVTGLSTGTALTVDSQQHIAGGAAVLAASPPNLLTQTGSSGPVQFTLGFTPFLSQFGFTRPELLANPFVSHPAWQVTAFDGAGNVVGQVGEAEIDSSSNVGAAEFSLGQPGGAGIARVVFASQGSGFTTFNAMLVDNLVLTKSTTSLPPAVAITAPVSGLSLAKPPAVTITAAASDASGIASVSFYANGVLLGTDTTPPYSVLWQNPVRGNYALTAVALNNFGVSQTSAAVNLVIQPSADLFGIATPPASQTVAARGSVTFSVVATGTQPVTYQWSQGKTPIPGATSSTLVVGPPISDGDAGDYTVAVSIPGQTIISGPATLTVVDAPVIATQPAAQTVNPGSEVVLNVAAAGTGPFTYQWLLNRTRIPGATGSTFIIPSAQPLNSGDYQAVVANLAASSFSAVAAVVVNTGVTILPTNGTFATRAGIDPTLGAVSGNNLSATAQPGAPLPDGLPGGNTVWFSWTPTFSGAVSLTTQGSSFDTVMAVYTGTALNNLKVVAADDDSGGFLTSLVAFNVAKGTQYQIAVDGFQGAAGRVVLGLPAGTGGRILNPTSGGSIPVIAKGPASQTVAPGAKATFSVQATSASKLSYQWYFQNVPIPGATGSSFSINSVRPAVVGPYYVLAANATGSAQSEPANLQIGVSSTGKAGSAENKFLDAPGGPTPASLAENITPFAAGGDTRGFSVSQVFSTVGATAEPGQPAPCGQVGSAAEWFVYTAPGGGMLEVNTAGSTFNTVIGVYTGTGTSFSTLQEAGCGYATNYLAEGQPSVLIPDVTQGTTFYILVAGYQGASGVAQVQIGLGQPLGFSGIPPSQLVTAGSNATLAVATTGSTPSSYQWQLNGANLPGGIKQTYTVTNAQAGAAGNYTVIVSNVVGVATSSPPAAVTVQFAPAIMSGPSNVTVAVGKPAKLAVAAIGVNVKTNPFVSQWFFNNAPLAKATNLTLSFSATSLTNGGNYYIVISNRYGVATSTPATLTVVPKAPAGVESPPGSGVGTVSTTIGGYPGGSPGTYGQESLNLKSADSLSSVAGTYSGLFYPAGGATEASSGFFTATMASEGDGAFSANLLLDGGSYSFAGQFDASGNAFAVVTRTGKSAVSASLHLSQPAQMAGVISNADWVSVLWAGRVVTNAAPDYAGQFALVFASGNGAPVGRLAVTNTPDGTAWVTGSLPDGAAFFRTAPIDAAGSTPVYVPLYSGQGLFLGWITPTNLTGQAFWIRPGVTNATGLIIVK